jgi:hypothetical protein
MDMARGLHPWDAVIDATTNRFRPIVLTAAAATLGMIPIASEVFWGPMAYAIIGGLFCFRGLANETYYILAADKSRYADYTGCGNTLNANEPTTASATG